MAMSSTEPGMSETYRQRCHTYVSTSVMGSVLEAVMAMFSIGSCVTFVWETYIDGPTPTWMFCAEMMFSVFFTFQYVLGLYVAPSRCRFVFSLHPIVDKVTVVPVLILPRLQRYDSRARCRRGRACCSR